MGSLDGKVNRAVEVFVSMYILMIDGILVLDSFEPLMILYFQHLDSVGVWYGILCAPCALCNGCGAWSTEGLLLWWEILRFWAAEESGIGEPNYCVLFLFFGTTVFAFF